MITQHQTVDEMKDSMRAPWIAGDFAAIAREIGVPEAEGFVARMGLEPDARVLDIACGTGNAIRLDAPKRAALLHDLEQLWIDNNLSTNRENHTLMSNEYLRTLATRRGL